MQACKSVDSGISASTLNLTCSVAPEAPPQSIVWEHLGGGEAELQTNRKLYNQPLNHSFTFSEEKQKTSRNMNFSRGSEEEWSDFYTSGLRSPKLGRFYYRWAAKCFKEINNKKTFFFTYTYADLDASDSCFEAGFWLVNSHRRVTLSQWGNSRINSAGFQTGGKNCSFHVKNLEKIGKFMEAKLMENV